MLNPHPTEQLTETHTNSATPIFGTGEMADRIRAFPWETTSMGAIATWPCELTSAVNQILCSPLPSLVFWGPEFIGIYNDSFLPVYAGRHPASLGQPAKVVWQELWHIIEPQLNAAFYEGKVVAFKKVPLTLTVDGVQQQMHWDYAYMPMRNVQGEILGVFEVAQDVTSSVLHERQRDAVTARLQQALEATHDAVCTIDRSWTMTYMNPAGKAFVGEVEGKNLWETFPDITSPELPTYALYHRAMEQNIPATFEAEYPAPINAIFTTAVIPTQEGIVTFSRDITENRRSTASLRSVADRLQLAQAAGQTSSWDWDLATGKIFWTESKWTWGRAPEELNTAENCFGFIHPEDVAMVQKALAPALENLAEYQCEFRVLWPDQSVHWCIARGRSSVPDSSGKPTRILGVLNDITERKQSEAALLQSEKLAAVGRLASSIAHEINNPLESVTNLLYLARTTDTVGDIHSYLETAERELRRVSVITNQTLRFHRQSTGPREVSCNDLFGDVLSVYHGRLLNSGIVIEKRKRAHRCVECFEGEIRQVLSNLVGNAIDAMHPQGGRLLVRSREAHDWQNGREGIVLTVADTGTGIAPQVLRKMFDAFYTTKGIGGTGLGLWVSKEIVDRHHGVLRVRSSQEKQRSGTVFSLFLPFAAFSQ